MKLKIYFYKKLPDLCTVKMYSNENFNTLTKKCNNWYLILTDAPTYSQVDIDVLVSLLRTCKSRPSGQSF